MFKQVFFKISVPVTALIISCSAFAHGDQGDHGDHDDQPMAAHLVFKQGELHIHAGFQAPPVVGKESILILEAKNPQNHQAVDLNDQVEVVLWMPSMGHGSAPTQVQRTLDQNGQVLPGVFTVRNVQFIMGGEWEVRIRLTDDRGQQEIQSFRLTLSGSGHGHH